MMHSGGHEGPGLESTAAVLAPVGVFVHDGTCTVDEVTKSHTRDSLVVRPLSDVALYSY